MDKIRTLKGVYEGSGEPNEMLQRRRRLRRNPEYKEDCSNSGEGDKYITCSEVFAFIIGVAVGMFIIGILL